MLKLYLKEKGGEDTERGRGGVGRGESWEEGDTGTIAKSSSFPASGGWLTALNQLGGCWALLPQQVMWALKKAIQKSPMGGHAPH